MDQPSNALCTPADLTKLDGFLLVFVYVYSVLVSVSCPKALYHLESDNIFSITVVVADWLG